MNWPSTPAGVLSEVACSTVSPTKLGVYTRQCGLDGLWMDPVDGCMDSLPSSFQYDQSSITMIVEGEVTINPQPNGISYTSYSLKNDKCRKYIEVLNRSPCWLDSFIKWCY